MTRIKIITFFFFIAIGHVFGQPSFYLSCRVYTVYSQNDKFILQTIPFDNYEETPTGKTIVFNSDSTMLYEIPRHFEVSSNRKEIFLSNDGKTIAYVINCEFEWDSVQYKNVEIFKNGVLTKQYQLTDLINCDSDNGKCCLFYREAIDTITWEGGRRKIHYKEDATDFEKGLTEKATFLNNDTLYIFARTGKLIKIDLNTVELNISSYTNVNEEWFSQIKPFEVKFKKYNLPSNSFPNLSNGKSFENMLAKYLDMAVFPEYKKTSNKYKRYFSSIEILVDTKGNATLDRMSCSRCEIPKNKVKSFLESHKFEANLIPEEIEMWKFCGNLMFMNKSKKEAKKEKLQEIQESREAYRKRIIADTINGLYIPQNLEECFMELNKILKPKDIETIKNLKDRNETILYHGGLGKWLRNNWGLWGGSRLQQYLIKKGIKHPDEMSAAILEYYYDWLNERHDAWRAF